MVGVGSVVPVKTYHFLRTPATTKPDRAAEMFMTKSKSFGGIPLTMSWYTAPFPGAGSAASQQPTRQSQQGRSGSAATAQSFQYPAPVINAGGAGDSIELKLAPIQQDSRMAGPRGGGGWGDNFGKEEGVGETWGGSTGWGRGNNNVGGKSGLVRRVVCFVCLCACFACPERARGKRGRAMSSKNASKARKFLTDVSVRSIRLRCTR